MSDWLFSQFSTVKGTRAYILHAMFYMHENGKLAISRPVVIYARIAREGGLMGVLDKKQKDYFEDPKRFADIWNGILFGGFEVIRWEELSECDSVLTYGRGKGMEKTADGIMKKTADGKLLAIMIL